MNIAILQHHPIDGKPSCLFRLMSSASKQTCIRPSVSTTCLPMHKGQSIKFNSPGFSQFNAWVRQHTPNILGKYLGKNCRSFPCPNPILAMHSHDDLKSLDDKDIDKDLMREFTKYSKCTNGKDRVAVAGGIGSTLIDFDGEEYLDFNCNRPFGHNGLETLPSTMAALRPAINRKSLKEEVSKQLIARSFAYKAFLTNSQIEAMDLVFAIARLYQQLLHPLSPGEVYPAVKFIAFIDAFHGKTMDLTSSLDHQGKPFAHQVPPGFTFVKYDDIETALKLIKEERFAALFVEPFQGKNGTDLATKAFLHALRVACNSVGCLLVFDEIQCGVGWTGNIWAHQAYGIVPDMMVVGDPLADGRSFGAVLVNDRVGRSITRAEQVISPISLAAVLEVVDKLSKPSFLGIVKKKAEDFKLLLINKIGGNSHVKEIRPIGLAVGIEFDVSALPLVEACRKSGLLISTFGTPNAIMLRPPLIISKAEINMGVEILLQSMVALDEDM